MFCFSCKYFNGSPVKKTVDAIKFHHPDEKIVIVDSMSEDKSYYDIFADDEKVHILDDCNPHRVPGAFYQTVKHFPDEPYYINIQDCFIIKKSWQEHIDSDKEFVSVAYFTENNAEPYGIGMDQWNYMEKVFGGTEYNNLAPGQRFNACFGPIYIIKNSLAKKFYDSGVLANMQSTCKLHDEVGERIFGILATYEGYDPMEHNMEGDILSRWTEMECDNMEYYTKIFGSRLGRT
jgi:hypothetical protein